MPYTLDEVMYEVVNVTNQVSIALRHLSETRQIAAMSLNNARNALTIVQNYNFSQIEYNSATALEEAGNAVNAASEALNVANLSLGKATEALTASQAIDLSPYALLSGCTFTGTVTANQPIVGSVTGSAARLTTGRNIALDGDATGQITFDGTTDKTITVTLANSGVTAKTYGPSDNVVGQDGTTIKVPQITVDAKGRVTAIVERTLTLVDTDTVATNTDYQVQQKVSSVNSSYPVILSATASTSDKTTTTIFSASIKANPSTGFLEAVQFVGNLYGDVHGNVTGDLTGTASKAIGDANGNDISSTYAKLNSPVFTGSPTAPNPVLTDNSQRIATTWFVNGKIGELINNSTEALDSINELAAALGNDKNFAVSVANTYVAKSVVKDAVNSTSSSDVASSKAVKTAYDKAVEALNAANAASDAAGSAAQSANALAGVTKGSGEIPIWLNNGTFQAWSVLVGSDTQPVWFNNGKVTACGNVVAKKIGTGDVGTTKKPVYINAGVPTVISDTVGGTDQPVYLSAGVITALSSSKGSASQPVWLNAGKLEACTSIAATTVGSGSIGSATKPIWINAGTPTAFSGTIGSNVTPVWVNAGSIQAFSGDVGSSTRPVFINGGKFEQCGEISATKLGTSTLGSTSRPVWLNTGKPEALSATVGGANKPVYLVSGTITACSATVGSDVQPVYMSAGNIVACKNMVTLDTTQEIGGSKVFNNTTIGQKVAWFNYGNNINLDIDRVAFKQLYSLKDGLNVEFLGKTFHLDHQNTVSLDCHLDAWVNTSDVANRPAFSYGVKVLNNGYGYIHSDTPDATASGREVVTAAWVLSKLSSGTIGTGTVGAANKPIYIAGGTPTAISGTFGSDTQPVWFNGGAITACGNVVAVKVGSTTANVGSLSQPVFMNKGVPTACTSVAASTVGSTSANTGSSSQPIFLNKGVPTACGDLVAAKVGSTTADTGSVSTPIFLNKGVPQACTSTFLDTTTAQSVTGVKTFSSGCVRVIVPGYNHSAATASGDHIGQFLFYENNGVSSVAEIRADGWQNNTTRVMISARGHGTSYWACLGVVYDLANSTLWAFAPNTPASPDDNCVITAKYLNSRLADGSVASIGTATVGGTGTPIWLNKGVPNVVSTALPVSLGGTGCTALTGTTGAVKAMFSTHFTADPGYFIMINTNYAGCGYATTANVKKFLHGTSVGSDTVPVYVSSSGVLTACGNVVTTSTSQTISGAKTFTSNEITIKSTQNKAVATSGHRAGLNIQDNTGTWMGQLMYESFSNNASHMIMTAWQWGGSAAQHSSVTVWRFADGSGYATCPTANYTPQEGTAIVTAAWYNQHHVNFTSAPTIDMSYPSMYLKISGADMTSTSGTSAYASLWFTDKNNTAIAYLQGKKYGNKGSHIVFGGYSSTTFKYFIESFCDANTPVPTTYMHGYTEFKQGMAGTTIAVGTEINAKAGSVFTKTISAATTFTIVAPNGAGCFTLILVNGGSKTITWPSTVKWSGGTKPVLSASGTDVLTFVTPNSGGVWYGTQVLRSAA